MLDSLLKFSTAQAITATAVSTNVLDMLIGRDEGAGNALELNVYVTTAFVSAGGASLQVSLEASVDNATFYAILFGPAVLSAALTLGAHLLAQPLPRLFQPLVQAIGIPRYIRLNYIVAISTFSAGKVDAWLSAGDRQVDKPVYPNNYVSA